MSEEIKGIFAGFSSAQLPRNNLFNWRLPMAERDWGSASRRPQVAEVLFPGEFLVDRITAEQISTDQTTHGFRWEIHLRHADGGYTVQPVVAGNANINRATFSVDLDAAKWPLKEGWQPERMNQPKLDFRLATPVKAVAGQLRMVNHHGWCGAVGLVFHGQRTGDLPMQLVDFIGDYEHDLRAFWFAES
jgi:hypothetical protein